jgi:lipoyl synthase
VFLSRYPMSHFLKVIHLCKGPAYRRCLATASPSAITSRSSTKFGSALESGPTLDDFLSGNLETIDKSERVVLGNTRR